MALQESFTRTDGYKFVLRQSNEGAWSLKCLAPPPPEGDTKQWSVAWEVVATVDENGAETPLTEAKARQFYEEYMG